MTTLQHKKIPIANLGTFEISLPLLELGDGNPRVLIINNLHGDELTGFYVLEKMLSNIPTKITGTLTIVTTANPLGLIQKQRFIPFDDVDLNREYPNPPKARGVAAALKDALLKIAMVHDIIIDLHTFMRPCLSAGLLLPHENLGHKTLVEQCLKVCNTDILLKMDFAKEEKRVTHALGSYLITQNKIVLAIEYQPVRNLTEYLTDHFAEGLQNVLSELGLFPSIKPRTVTAPPLYERQQIINQTTGLFLPLKPLGSSVKIKEILGHIIDVNTLTRTPIHSPYEGLLIEIADRQLYRFGEKLATVGRPVK